MTLQYFEERESESAGEREREREGIRREVSKKEERGKNRRQREFTKR